MYYVVTDSGVLTGNKVDAINKRHNVKLDELDFKKLGPDSIVYCNKENLEFLQDAKKLNDIGLSSLFKKDNSTKLMLYIIIGMTFITMIKG